MKFDNEDKKAALSEKNTSAHNAKNLMKERNRLAYILIAFHQGVSYISQLAIQYFFKDELKVEPSHLAWINSVTHIPWAIKPILGLITDLLPICGYRRKIYIILCGILNLFCWVFMAFYAHTTGVATAVIFLVNLTLSFCSVLGEAVVVELAKMEKTDKNSKAKDFVSTFFLCRTIGELLSAYLKGLFVDIMPLRTIFLIACFIPSLIVISGFILIESPTSENNNNNNEEEEMKKNEEEKISLVQNISGTRRINNKSNNNELNNRSNMENGVLPMGEAKPASGTLLNDFINFMCQKYVIIPLAFIIIFKATPSYYDAFFYFITNELKFSASDLGKISFCSTIAILIAIWIYKKYLKDFNFKSMITIGTIVSFFVSFLCYILVLRINLKIGVPDFWLLLFTNSFLSLIGELVLLPILSLACVLCPKNLEGTVYSIFMSSLNLGGILSQVNGSLCTSVFGITSKNYGNLHWFILFAKFVSLLPLPILICISNNYFEPKEKDDNEDDLGKRKNASSASSEAETDRVARSEEKEFESSHNNNLKTNKNSKDNYVADNINSQKTMKNSGELNKSREREVFGNNNNKNNNNKNSYNVDSSGYYNNKKI